MFRDGIKYVVSSIGKERLLSKSMRNNFPFVKPSAVSINITARCNSRCIYCDSWKTKSVTPREPTVAEMRQLSAAAKKLGAQFLTISGGEPLLRNDLEEIVAAAVSEGLWVTVITNGILLSPQRLNSLANAGLKMLNLSLDTFEAEIYRKLRGVSYRLAEKALETLVYSKPKYHGLRINLNCVISQANIAQLEPFAKEFFTRFPGLGTLNFQAYDRSWNGNPELLPALEQKPVLNEAVKGLIALKKAGYPIGNSEAYLASVPDFFYQRAAAGKQACGSGFTSICVSSDLSLHPCYLFPAIADLKQEDLHAVWFSEKMKAQRAKMLKGECAGCSCLFHKPVSLKQTICNGFNIFLNEQRSKLKLLPWTPKN